MYEELGRHFVGFLLSRTAAAFQLEMGTQPNPTQTQNQTWTQPKSPEPRKFQKNFEEAEKSIQAPPPSSLAFIFFFLFQIVENIKLIEMNLMDELNGNRTISMLNQ